MIVNIMTILYLVLAGSAAALLYALLKTRWIYRQPVENDELRRIGGYISEGAMAFLSREYRVLIPFIALIAVFLAFANKGALRYQSAAFILGAAVSLLAGYIGMKVATAANSRTAQAAKNGGLNPALKVAFSGGSVMGMSVVGLALLGLFIVFSASTFYYGSTPAVFYDTILPLGTAFSLGASSVALFSRVGGGIFTKAADVGADLVGKVEANIPEDDPRNPATIADNVGDNVGDVAGMGADLFESFVGSIIGAMILGLTVSATDTLKIKLMLLPLIIAVLGIAASLIGTLFVRSGRGGDPQKALNAGTFSAALLAAVFLFAVLNVFIGEEMFNGSTGVARIGILQIFGATVTGLVSGVLIGLLSEYYTGTGKAPVISIMNSCDTGSATAIITGIGVGMRSAFPTILLIAAAIWGSYSLADLYGVGIAAVGMLVTLGIQLAVDAYGPIADNAGGLAQMAQLPHEVREITDSLDAVGNTTAAIGKGFAIGSAALTAIILFTSFREHTNVASVNITDIPVLTGILIGVAVPFLFSALAMSAVGKAAHKMIEEVRSQFKMHPGILSGSDTPDYKRCVDISTQAAIKEMLIPGLIAVITPILIGFTGGPAMLIGMLTGVTGSGVVLAIFMANAGGAWDNAKKMIESGSGAGKGSDAHKAAVVGDTVGDPFKDTAGPAINILIKLMSMVSLVIAPMLKIYWNL